ncbi:TonB-dependent receptor [Sphingomonas montana]|uniref:TonB-dependent receptor n=1 Tax=Sphingomonas montana TaxID=1843236 RepID=UPI00096F1E55|nr:TonB-dependent receptor [Sphingomonas montana]
MLRASLFALLPAAASAQPGAVSETIVVSGQREAGDAVSFETRHALSPEMVGRLDAMSADEIVRRLPGLHVPTNSRGEAVAFVRNAGERQVTVFFEGASINIPWDNRLDLSLLPAGLIGGVRTAAGPLAPHYGVNALAAISLSPVDAPGAQGQYGTGDQLDGRAAVRIGPAIVGGSYARRDGDPLSDDADLPFSQPGRRLRTNTDRELASLFGRVAQSVGDHDLSLAAFHVRGAKGIAPEGNRASGARFWRYPDIRHTLIAGNARSRLTGSTELDSALWYQRFGQTIDSHADADYDRITAQQVDRDRTWGVRELLKHRSGPATFVGSLNLQQSTHRQRDIGYVGGSRPAVLPATLSYSQRNWSVGGEVEYAVSPVLRAEIGAGYDAVDYVRTGDKPPVPTAGDWTGRIGLILATGDGWLLRAAVGRKMRAPTMRERFGEAINRFLPNPDLDPERIITAELGAEWRGAAGGFYLIPFVQDLKNTIDQRTAGGLRQRINLDGSTVRGLELGGSWQILPPLAVAGNATWTQVRRKGATAGQPNRIAEKPALIASINARYAHPSGISAMVEARHVGEAYSADPAGALVALERSTSLDGRIGYGWDVGNRKMEIFLHAGNIGDTWIEPQLGLPAPGRSVRIGLQLG